MCKEDGLIRIRYLIKTFDNTLGYLYIFNQFYMYVQQMFKYKILEFTLQIQNDVHCFT